MNLSKVKHILRPLLLLISVVSSGYAQDKNILLRNSMQVFLGPSFHGSDNVLGLAFSTEYSHYFYKKLSLSVFAGTTIHDGESDVIFWNSNGQVVDGKVNFTTAGFQTGIALGYNFYQNTRHQVQGSLGALLRYQTTSNPDIVGLYTTYPYTDIEFKARSVAFGGLAAISYNYSFNNNAFIGVKALLQYDSNDDALNMFSFAIGKRF